MKIIFDASPLVALDSKTASRSGIFVSTLAILEEFSKKHEILIYADHKSYAIFKNSEFFRQYKILEPKSMWVKYISQLYHYRIKLDPYRKNLFIRLLCRSITLSAMCLEVLTKESLKESLLECDRVGADCFFSTFSTRNSVLKIPNFTLLHDVTPVLCSDCFSWSGRYSFESYVLTSLNSSSYYFANSHYTKADFLKLFSERLDGEKIKVTHLGASKRFWQDLDGERNQKIREKYGIPKEKRYIFSLCTLEPRKNLIFVVENFLELITREGIEDLIFILGGGYWSEFVGKIQERFQASRGRVLHIGYVDDEDLSNLFSHSFCSVYLSLYEGFGLPVLESMQCGCPVIASNTTSIPEIVGESGILIEPRDKEALQSSLLELYRSPSLREILSRKGLERAREFGWEKCAGEMIAYMEEVVGKNKDSKQ